MAIFSTLSKITAWDRCNLPKKGKFYVILGAGSIIGGAVSSIAFRGSKIALCTGIALYTVGGVSLVEAFYKMHNEWQKEVELEAFRAQPTPVFMPQMKRYLELEMNMENAPYKVVEEAAIRVLKTASERLEHKVDNTDVFCQYYSLYLDEKIASLEKTRSQQGEDQSATSQSKSFNIIMLEALCQSAVIYYGKHIAKSLAKSDIAQGSKGKGFTKFVKIVSAAKDSPETSPVTEVENKEQVQEIHMQDKQREELADLNGSVTSPSNGLENLEESLIQTNMNGHQDNECNGVEEYSKATDSIKQEDSSENGLAHDDYMPVD